MHHFDSKHCFILTKGAGDEREGGKTFLGFSFVWGAMLNIGAEKNHVGKVTMMLESLAMVDIRQ